MREEAVLFGETGTLAGVLARPGPGQERPERPAFLLLNAGVTHRVGPNRLYVRLARDLAAAGFSSLRFDYSGLGDSAVRRDRLPPERSVFLETQEAMDFLAATHGLQRFAMLGICSGAAIAYVMAQEDPRVVGAVLINGQQHLHGRDPALGAVLRDRSLARHSWRIALFSSFRSKNWVKAFRGKLDPANILRMMVVAPLGRLLRRRPAVAAPEGPPADPLQDLQALAARGVRLFHLYCEGDEGLDYFHVVLGRQIRRLTTDGVSRVEVLRGANHVFTMRWSQDRLLELVRDWASEFSKDQGAAPV